MFVYSKLKILVKGEYIASSKRLGGFIDCGIFNEFFAPTFKIIDRLFGNYNIISVETDLRCIRQMKSNQGFVKTTNVEDYCLNSQNTLQNKVLFCKDEMRFCSDPMVRYLMANYEELFPDIIRAVIKTTPGIFIFDMNVYYSDIFSKDK